MYRIAAYSQNDSLIAEIERIADVSKFMEKYETVWLDVVSPTGEDLENLGETFKFHKLALEDSVQTTQRSKVDNYQDHFFMIMKAVSYNEVAETCHIAMFVGKNYIVTIRECFEPDMVKPIFDKISIKSPSILKNTTDYLCYLMIDSIVDSYLPIFDLVDDRIEELEAEIVENITSDPIPRILRLKKDLLVFRKAIFPTLETIVCLQRADLPNITRKNLLYFNDVYDHVVEVVDLLETSRDMISGALEIYMSKAQNVTNELAKMFAMFAIILMWPTVIGAIYGMNFDIPEREMLGPYSYFYAIALMFIMMAISWLYFKRKKWI